VPDKSPFVSSVLLLDWAWAVTETTKLKPTSAPNAACFVILIPMFFRFKSQE
jgi:hypothetical protein